MAGHNITQNRMTAGRALISALALLVVFCGMAAAEQLYVNESGWWWGACVFNASGAPIQAAVDAAGEGDAVYVYGGNYYENVDVDKPRLTLEGAGADVVTVTAASPDDHVFEVTKDYTSIAGFAVRGATDSNMAGVYLGNVDHCNISMNGVYGNANGINLDSSSNNTLTNNTAFIYLRSSSDNALTGNTANSNIGIGIYMYYSSNNTLTSNTASDNRCGIYLRSSSNNELTGNTANSNSDNGIDLYYSSNNTLTGNTANSNSDNGIYLQSSSNNTLTRNTISDNCYGIYLYNADNNNITCNLMRTNTKRGFYLTGGRTGNNISYNNIIENGNYNTMSGGWEWQFYINQYQPVEAKHNYWGAGMNNTTIDASIYDDEEGGWGAVKFYPFETEPVPCAPTPEEPHTSTTMDAVIALQIAVGSRPPDLRYDVSGDKRVTSLDALMILQVAAGTPEYPITGCKDLDQSILRMYDENGDGRIDAQWTINAGIDLDEGRITQSEYDQVKYAYEHGCPVDVDTE